MNIFKVVAGMVENEFDKYVSGYKPPIKLTEQKLDDVIKFSLPDDSCTVKFENLFVRNPVKKEEYCKGIENYGDIGLFGDFSVFYEGKNATLKEVKLAHRGYPQGDNEIHNDFGLGEIWKIKKKFPVNSAKEVGIEKIVDSMTYLLDPNIKKIANKYLV